MGTIRFHARRLGAPLLILRGLRSCWRTGTAAIVTRIYRSACLSFGKGVRIHGSVWIQNPSRTSVGDDVMLFGGARFTSELSDAFLKIGNGVQVNEDAHIDYTGGLEIGNDALVSEGALIYTHDHGLDPRSTPSYRHKTIERNAWIGARAIIMPSCTRIGSHAVIGAGAIVTQDVEDGTVVAGNPARPIRRR